ncbi:MAG: hypothetical protein GBAus27B_000098 [Mycoplasmataceae bacterium]|nr:MAG: hypothetical protein GBAus27B_000098 [Mycoplasmataceae bacterium]
MHKNKGENFSLYSWLLKKLHWILIVWYSFTVISSFFYYQAFNGLKFWGCFQDDQFPYSSFFKIISLNSRIQLIWYCFFCFFLGFLLTNLVCEYYKNYNLELGRFYCRKLIIKHSAHKKISVNSEIRNNFLSEVELFIPVFVLVPQKIFAAIVNIVFALVFLNDFKPDNFAIYFIIFASISIAFFSFIFYRIQNKINQKLNRFRQQENKALENYLEKKASLQEVENIINSNFRKNHLFLWKKTFSYLPNFIIPGLIILFCFIYSLQKSNSWEIKEFTQVYAIAGSIQNIFWKIKDINDNLPDLGKIQVYYKSLQKSLSK